MAGDKEFFINKASNNRLYAGALYVIGGPVSIECLSQLWVLQPNYGAGNLPTSGYIENNKFSISGEWGNSRQDHMSGSATGTVSADDKRVTISWPKPSRCFVQGGTNVVLTRTP